MSSNPPEPAPGRPSVDAPGLIARLEEEWETLAPSRLMRERLAEWRAEDRRLAFETGGDLVAAAQRRSPGDWQARDEVLAAVLDRCSTDPLAQRVALQIVLPAVRSLVSAVRQWDRDERASRVVSEALEVLAQGVHTGAGTAPGFRVYANTRRRVLRAAARERSDPVRPLGDLADIAASTPADPGGEERQLLELIEWVQSQARVPADVARDVVLTRAGGVAAEDLAAALGVPAQTLRRRRLRTEQSLRRSLSIER